MSSKYDICNDYDTLCQLEDKLKKIKNALGTSADIMLFNLRNSGEFLSGNQYNKASQTTIQCSDATRYTMENIDVVLKYIAKLKKNIEEYNRCGYSA